ncbi:MAG: SPOR domain-containing protein [Bacteroidota bacterium]|nr:SPOR domain-containing protein [Bacteroidota bacterium]
MLRYIFLLTALLLGLSLIRAQDNEKSVCLSKEELRLYNLISSLRIDNGLDLIPLSSSLTLVAKTHVKDLEQHHPDTSVCNYHSWSDKGDWAPCCYNIYVTKPECMLNKPKELSGYAYPAYELILWDSEEADPDSVMQVWASVEESVNMFVQDGKWKKRKWSAIGVAISENYASVWFGERPDKLDPPSLCGTERQLSSEELANTEAISKSGGEDLLAETGTYHIIFGSYSNREEARSVLKSYQDQFPDSGIIKGESNFRISLASYPSLQEAKNVRDEMGGKYKKAWILKF